jgi:hypothetical protein
MNLYFQINYTVKFTNDILTKCIRADKDLSLPSYEEELKLNIEECEYIIKNQQKNQISKAVYQ